MEDSLHVAPHIDTPSEREFTTLLLNMYRDCPELWKVKHKHYFNRTKKTEAFDKIVEALKLFKPDFTVNKLKQKINCLRTNFNRERKSFEGKRASGDDTSEPSLWYYNDISFITDQIEMAPKLERLLPKDASTAPNTALPSSPRTAQSSGLLRSHKRKKNQPDSTEHIPPKMFTSPTEHVPPKKFADSTEQLVGLATEFLNRPETEEDLLAKGWAMKLKKLPPDQKLFAEKIINDTLFEAEMGTLTRDGAHFVTRPRQSSPPQSSTSTHPSYGWQRFPHSPNIPSVEPVYSSPSPSPSPTHKEIKTEE